MPVEAIDLPSFRMRRALLAFGSESASEDRAREQVQRVADPSSQPPASRRSIGARGPDEGFGSRLDSCSRGRPRTSRRPRVGRHAGCTRSICYKLQAEAIRGLQPRSDRTIAMATHAHATGGGFPDARLLLPAGRVHLVCITQGICSWHARMLTQIGRQRPL